MRTFWNDLKYGLRMLASKPGFTAVAILTLALGIGANTAIFSVVYGVVVKPLPYHQPGRLIRIYSQFTPPSGGGFYRFWLSPPEFLDLKRDTTSWQTLDAWVNGNANLTGSVNPIRVNASFVTGGLLESLGVSPIRGRNITAQDDAPGANQVAVISEGLFKRAFGGDSSAIGKDTLLNGAKCTIIGVMPATFEFPPGELNPPDMWVPLQLDPAKPGGRASHFLYLVGRLKPGVGLPQAESEMAQLVRHYGETAAPKTHAFRPGRHSIVMYPLQDEVVRTVRPALLMLLGAVFFVLLIACVNVANLLLARAEIRQREIAVRTALGASVGRLARQFVTEGTLLALAGAAAGMLLAYGGLRVLMLTNAGMIPRVGEIALDSKTLLYALATCLATGIFFGLAPLAHVVTGNLHGSLKAAAGRTTASTAAHWFRRILVVGEIALAMVLLVGSGLMVRGFWKLLQVNPGFDARGLLTMQVALPGSAYKDASSRAAFWTRLQERLSSLPGVESAAIATGLPPARRINANDTDIEGLAPGPNMPIQNVDYYQGVTPSYFQTMKIRLLEGRFLDEHDGPADHVVVINEAMAHHFYGSESPLGRRIRPGSGGDWVNIVGVVADVKNAGLDQAAGTEIFLPFNQSSAADNIGLNSFTVILRASADPASLTSATRSAIQSADPQLPVANIRTMDDVMQAAESRPRFLTLLLGMFSALALSLAAVGIYGLMAYSVTQRTNEIGIRMALGAQQGNVLRMVLGQGMTLALVGMIAGLGGAFLFTRAMKAMLFGVTTTDPLTFIAGSLALAAIAAIACYIPARRATKVDPLVALRYE